MTVTIGSITLSNLTAQPFGYEESNTKSGQTSRQWLISGLLTPAEWVDLINEYNSWRDTRITDEDTLKSGTVGTVISFSGTGAGEEGWEDIDCWFNQAPQGQQSGAYILATVSLVDAEEALQVLLKQQEVDSEEEDLDLGTITVGEVELKLLAPPDSYGQVPSLQLTAGGVHYVTGPFVADKVQNIEGATDAEGWDGIRDWYEEEVTSIPESGDWYPISAPTATARSKVVSGIKTIEYVVSLSLGQVI